jgi:hypothetical protein
VCKWLRRGFAAGGEDGVAWHLTIIAYFTENLILHNLKSLLMMIIIYISFANLNFADAVTNNNF